MESVEAFLTQFYSNNRYRERPKRKQKRLKLMTLLFIVVGGLVGWNTAGTTVSETFDLHLNMFNQTIAHTT